MGLFLLLVVPALLALAAASSTAPDSRAVSRRSDYRSTLPQAEESLPSNHELLDIVLVASVDGKFHALNRTSGHTLWSMSSFATTTSVSAPSSLSPLVRTTHPKYDSDLVDDYGTSEEPHHETYIIEPQSGDIYVLHSPSSPLQRFPFSMSQLVDISPFTSVSKDDTKVFVGRKETSLLLIELETGRIKATLNSECPFIPDEYQDSTIDLDDLESTKPPISAPTEVYIGRTDYHIAIHKKPRPGQPTPPVQELSFSTYGPNNKDNQIQATYRRTHDNTYIQSLPSGEIIAFRTKPPPPAKNDEADQKTDEDATRPLWAHHFSAPVVAIFDVLQSLSSSHHQHPFVLLQPRPRLQDLFPTLNSGPGLSGQLTPNLGSAYVGLVEETGSLFVMSPERYPLVVFGGSERSGLGGAKDPKHPRDRHKALDPPLRVDDDHNDDSSELDGCLLNPYDVHCLTGVRPLEEGDGIEGRMRRLLDSPKTVPTTTTTTTTPAGQQPVVVYGQQPMVVEVGQQQQQSWGGGEGENSSGKRDIPTIDDAQAHVQAHVSRWPWMRTTMLESIGGAEGESGAVGIGGAWEAVVVMLLFGLVTVWLVWAKVKRGWTDGGKKSATEGVETETQSVDKKDVEVHSGEKPNVNGDATNTVEQGLEANVGVNDNLNDARLESSLLDAPTPKAKLSSILVNENDQPSGIKKELSIHLPPNTATPTTPNVITSTPVPDAVADEGDDSDVEAEGGVPPTPGKRKARRGKRGKKKKAGFLPSSASGDGIDKEDEGEKKPPSLVLTTSSPKLPLVPQPSLVVSDTILGFGSHGTVVFQGSLQGRAVAVKRLLQDFVTLAAREVSILQESDDHPNVIRYYYQESHANFLYIALELCPASLADIIETPDREQCRDIAINFDPKKALKQIASGLRHLHALKLVHRDIKPQNILVSLAKSGSGFGGGSGARGGGLSYRMLISDFGLCKKLDVDQTSFLPTAQGAMGAGTVGWRAPEILRGEVKLDELNGDDASMSSRGSVATINGAPGTPSSSSPTRLTKNVDIFALGCLFYYTITNGGHPYGDRFEREVNIMRDAKDLCGLERFGEEGTEAKALIGAMLSHTPSGRPDTTTILLHPFFWDPGRRLNFLQDASDRFEIMCRDPKDAHLLALEKGAQSVVGNDWHMRLDKIFIENLGKYRKYDGKSVQDLMRALRNKKHHYQDLPDNVKRHLGRMPEGFLGYFTRRYPRLFLHVYGVIKDTGLHTESMFRTYFELPDS